MNNNESITIKDIAELARVDERTVRRWIDNLADTPDNVSCPPGQDIQGARPFHPIKQKTLKASEAGTTAYLTTEDALAILCAGGRQTLVDVLTGKIMLTQNLPALPTPQTGTRKQKGEITHYKTMIRELKSIIRYQKTFIQKQLDYIKLIYGTNKSAKTQKQLSQSTTLIKKNCNEPVKFLSISEIASLLGKHKTSIHRRAERESWDFYQHPGKGGLEKRFHFATLPPDVQQAWHIHTPPLS